MNGINWRCNSCVHMEHNGKYQGFCTVLNEKCSPRKEPCEKFKLPVITSVCPVCGKSFESPKRLGRMYCSTDCARIQKQRNEAEFRAKRRMKPKPDTLPISNRKSGNIDKDIKAAKEAGLSYGQYKMRQYMEGTHGER